MVKLTELKCPESFKEYHTAGVFRDLKDERVKYTLVHPAAVALVLTIAQMHSQCSPLCVFFMYALLQAPLACFIHSMFNISLRLALNWSLQGAAIALGVTLTNWLLKKICCRKGKCTEAKAPGKKTE
jgi:hypothetical protein